MRPFAIHATLDGAPVEGLAAEGAFYVLFGTAEVVGPTSLRVPAATDRNGAPLGTLELTWDGTPAPDAVLEPALSGQAIRILLLADPNSTGPAGEPLPVPGFRVATGSSPEFRHRLLVWEGAYAQPNGIAAVFAPAGPHAEDALYPDIPDFLVEPTYASWEPAECGLVYYDALSAFGDGDRVPLGAGDEGRVPVATEAQPWIVRHVDSWHRDGRCEGQAQAWSQLAAFRPLPAAP